MAFSYSHYLNKYVVSAGYTKETDMVEYFVNISGSLPELYHKVINRIDSSGFTILEFQKRSELKKYLQPVFKLMNVAYANINGYKPVDDKEADEFGKR